MRLDLVPHCLIPTARASNTRSVLSKQFHKVWEDRVDTSLKQANTEGVWIGGYQVENIFKKGRGLLWGI